MQITKKVLAVLLAIVLTLSAGGSGIGAFSTGAAENTVKVGDVISFGDYPQTDVTSRLGSVLNGLGGTWVSYGYYQGNDSDGSMAPANYMFYKDVIYNGVKYRGVKFDTYRPYWTEAASTLTCANYQIDNQYYAGRVYWFKFEPIRWRVLDPAAGLVMCTTAIDSQPFNSFNFSDGKDGHNGTAYWGNPGKNAYANNYAQSSIRQWLVGDFYNTAFSDEQKTNIKSTALNNNCNNTLNGLSGYAEYDAPSTNDKVFLLSYAEARNSEYGFVNLTYLYDSAREIKGSDYAKCQGLYVVPGGDYAGNVWWWLRTPKAGTRYACAIGSVGDVNYQGAIGCTGYGVVPAMCLADVKNSSTTPENEYTVTVIASPMEGGIVTGAGKYAKGTAVTLKATTNAGWSFSGWFEGDTVKGINSTYAFTVTDDVTLTAKFTKAPITVSLNANGGSVTPMLTLVYFGEPYGKLPTPTRDGYWFLGWFDGTTKITESTIVTHTTLHALTAHWLKGSPSIEIDNYVESRKVDYRTTITFKVKDDQIPAGTEVHWLINNEDVSAGSSCTVTDAKKDFTVQVKLMQGSTELAASQIETVKVNSGFFARLKAFFRNLFHRLPVITQEFLGIEKYE